MRELHVDFSTASTVRAPTSTSASIFVVVAKSPIGRVKTVARERGQDGRHVDLIWPLWNLFDLTPEGRGTNWDPSLRY